MTVYVQTSFNEIAAKGLLPPEARIELRVDAAKQVDAELRGGVAKNADRLSDDFVGWNFNKTWRRGRVPAKATFGTDYDYYGTVAKECLELWNQWVPGNVQELDWDGYKMFGSADMEYKSSLGIWQNGKEITFDMEMTGPEISIGPKVDYGLFLEKWNLQRSPNIYALQQIGVLHAIAIELQARWLGVHHIYAMSTMPDDTDAQGKRRHRTEPVTLFPVIRIQSRHQ